MTSFVVEYSTSDEFEGNNTIRVEGKTIYFLSGTRLDNGTTGGVYEADITGLQVIYNCR